MHLGEQTSAVQFLCPTPHTPNHFIWNIPRLARSLSTALGLSSKFSALAPPRTFQIGTWSVDAAPAILTLQPDSSALKNVICELALRLRRPFILLGPTNNPIDANCQELLATARAAFFPLENITRVDDIGALHAIKAPGEIFTQFTPQPREIEKDVAQKAFALITQLDPIDIKPPSLLSVFRLYCLEEQTTGVIARRYKSSKPTIRRRLRSIHKLTGLHPNDLRRISTHLEKVSTRHCSPNPDLEEDPTSDD